MSDQTRDSEIVGRRESDGTIHFKFNYKRALALATLLGVVIGIMGWGVDALGSQVVTPPALKVVTDSVGVLATNQKTFTQAQVRQNARLTEVERGLSQMQVVLEIVAIQACRDLRSDPYAYRKANCAQYLEGK